MKKVALSLEYYDKVFARFSVVLKAVHKTLNFGTVSVFVERNSFNIRWTVRKSRQETFVHNIPISFESLGTGEISDTEMSVIAEDLVKSAFQTIPENLLRIDNE
jgi:hypothetical protein